MTRVSRCSLVAAISFLGCVFVGVPAAFAADQCTALGGTLVPPVTGECQIASNVTATGTFNLNETLHVLGGGHIDASSGGITLNICVAPATPGACDLILDTPTIAGGGQIEANDDAGASCNSGADRDNACPITINVSRDVLMQAGSSILAENNCVGGGPCGGGSGGNITITAGGNMTMCGQTGAQPGCGASGGNLGALISSRKTSGAGDTGVGGDITITIGDATKVAGSFYMEGGVKTYAAETGARIFSSGTGPSGDITITSGGTYFTEPGSVVEAGGTAVAPSAIEQGGKIYLVSDCGFTTEGRITSKGPDPGGDLVHLESCEVIIRGLVESTGKGHTVNNDFGFVPPHTPNPAAPGPPNNSCDNNADGLTNEVVHTDKAYNATGCIEVWGKVITIDSGVIDPAKSLTDSWAGELNADIGDGGTKGMGWIDIYAFSKLTIIDGTGNDRESDNLGHTYFSTYAVHANSVDGSDGTPGAIRAFVTNGPLTASGKAFEASSTMTNDTGHGTTDEFAGAGSDGGTIDVEASGTVTLDTAWLNASGDFNATGGVGLGGHIIVNAWGVGSNISWKSGNGDVRPNATGDIQLTACGGIDITGTPITEFHGEVPSQSFTCVAPTIPAYVVFDQTTWALCSASTISGLKFNDLNGNGQQDPGEPFLSGWTIHLFNGSFHALQTTSVVDGSYTFTGVPVGTYTVCEALTAATPPWQQTFPTSGANCLTAVDPNSDNLTPGPVGYTVDLTTGECCTGQHITGKDFGNIQLASKSGMKWEDINGNGAKNVGDNGLPNWKIHLDGTAVNGNAVHQTANTDAGGLYSFTVLPGSYTVCEELQPNWVQTFPATPVACDASVPTPGSKGYTITLKGGQVETGNDFGNAQYASKSGMKFEDLNGNGAKNAGEPGLPNWTIHLDGTAGDGSPVHLTQITGATGTYSFTGVLPGAYTVCEELKPNWIQTFPATSVTCDASVPTPGSKGYTITLTSGKVETGNDFGNAQYASKSGTKWLDVNGNGVRDLPGDSGIVGWKIHLFGTAGNGTPVHRVVSTIAAGAYTFSSLLPGTYTVCEEQPAPSIQTFPTSGANCLTTVDPSADNPTPGKWGYSITLASGRNETGNDFGNDPHTTPVCTDLTPPTVVVTGLLSSPTRVQITVKDNAGGSGLQTILVTVATNTTVAWPAFVAPLINPGSVLVTATKINASLGSTVGLRATDKCGNSTLFDPATVTVNPGRREAVTVTGVWGDENLVTIINNGLNVMRITVNGQDLRVDLKNHETKYVDIGKALKPGTDNVVTFEARGEPGADAVVLVAPGTPPNPTVKTSSLDQNRRRGHTFLVHEAKDK